MPRQRVMLAGGLAVAVAATAIVASLTFANDSSAAVPSAGTTRVSVDSDGHQANEFSDSPSISADGRYVAFTTDQPFSPIDEIDASPSGSPRRESRPDADVYVRDTKLGTTTLISHGIEFNDGVGPPVIVPGWGDSDQPSISADGRFIAFRTDARNIASNDFINHNVVVCDRDPDGNGELNDTCSFTAVSPVGEDASNPSISADGHRVSFEVPPAPILFLKKLNATAKAAAAPQTPDNGNAGWIEFVNLHSAANGTLEDPQPDDHAYLTAPVNLDITKGTETSHFTLNGQDDSTMATGGGHIAFVAHYLANSEGDPSADAVFDADLTKTGNPLTRLDQDGSGNFIANGGREFSHPALSGDGRRYAFADFQNKVGDQPRVPSSVRLYDRGPNLGDRPSVEIASRKTDGTAGLGAQPAFSADGRYLAFTTPSAGMHNGTDPSNLEGSCLGAGASTYCDIVVRDVILDAARVAAGLPRLPAELASPSINCTPIPCEGTGDSGDESVGEGGSGKITGDGSAVLSADGSVVAYGSEADDLVANDTNRAPDVFRHEFQPALAGDPQDFADVPLGAQSVKDVPLTHVGSGPLQVTKVTVDGADFDVFPGEACTTVTLHPTEKCVVSVRFKPTVLGPRTGTLQVTIRGVNTPLSVPLTGNGVPPPKGILTAAPTKLDFGARPVLRTSPIKSVTLGNTGDAPLAIGTITLGAATSTTFPGDYQKAADTCANKPLAPGATCRIDVRQRPTAVGVRPAVLTISYDTTLSFPISLTGAGSPPTLTSSPTVTPAGRVIQVTGKDFPPGSTAKLSLVGMPGTTTAKARADGTFQVPFVVLPNTWTGKHPLNADVLPATAPGLTGALRATLEFVIVPGSPVPPDFDVRK